MGHDFLPGRRRTPNACCEPVDARERLADAPGGELL